MQLSYSGRVVLIDDDRDEIQPLLETLGKHCIPYLYFDGKESNLPDSPPGGIRFVFLDIELEGMKGQSPKNQASALVARLQRIISKSNGPYVIIFWTKHKEVIEQVIQNCKSVSITPVCFWDMEKSECLQGSKQGGLQVITKKLEETLNDIGVFFLYVEWENLINSSAKDFVYDLTRCFEDDQTSNSQAWNKKTELIFYRLFRAVAEHGEGFDAKEKLRAAYHLLNRAYLDKLELFIARDSPTQFLRLFDPTRIEKEFFEQYLKGESSVSGNYSKDGEKDEGPYVLKADLNEKSRQKVIKNLDKIIDAKVIGQDTIAKLNSALFITESVTRNDVPGSVFITSNDDLIQIIIKSITDSSNLLESQLCFLLLTPECDIAQRKAIIHRILYGVLISNIQNEKLKKGDHLFTVGPFWHDNKIHHLVLNFQTLSTLSIDKLVQYLPVFSLKRDLFFDLQSKASNHVNRLGNFQLGQ